MSFAPKASRFILATTLTLSLLTSHQALSSDSNFSSDIFAFDSPEKAKGCHVSLTGKTEGGFQWMAHDVTKKDITYHQKAFGNPTVMAGFATGQTRSPESVSYRINNSWMPRFAQGNPHGGLTLFEKETEEPIGHVVAGGGDGPGVSEIAYTLMEDSWDGKGVPSVWGKGIMSSVVSTIATQWAPEVIRLSLDEDTPKAIREAFCCFGGESLQRLDATASPRNIGSWKILLKNGFQAAKSNVFSDDYIADFDGKELTPLEVENKLLKLFDVSCEAPLKKGARYQMIGIGGDVFTTSHHANYDCMKFHFENLLE